MPESLREDAHPVKDVSDREFQERTGKTKRNVNFVIGGGGFI
jgi:hypothetical protein